MSLKSTLRTAASAYSGLTALLGTSPCRWYDDSLVQGSPLPAVVVLQVAGSSTYVFGGRLQTGFSLLQFTIWGSGSDSQNALAVEAQLLAFLDQCNLVGISGLVQYPNYVVGQRDAQQPNTSPPVFQRLVDVRMFTSSRFTG